MTDDEIRHKTRVVIGEVSRPLAFIAVAYWLILALPVLVEIFK